MPHILRTKVGQPGGASRKRSLARMAIVGTCGNSLEMRPRRSTVTSIGSNPASRSEEHTSELQSLMRNSYAVFCLKTKNKMQNKTISPTTYTLDRRIKYT